MVVQKVSCPLMVAFVELASNVSSGSLDVSPHADEAGEPSYTK